MLWAAGVVADAGPETTTCFRQGKESLFQARKAVRQVPEQEEQSAACRKGVCLALVGVWEAEGQEREGVSDREHCGGCCGAAKTPTLLCASLFVHDGHALPAGSALTFNSSACCHGVQFDVHSWV